MGIVLFFLFLCVSKGYASCQKDNYLWIEFQEIIKERDGSVTLALRINYGRFPDKKEADWELDNLRVFYCLVDKDNEEEQVFYEACIEKNLINIKAFKTERLIVLVEAKRKSGGVTYFYLAKASVILFGHSFSKRKHTKPVLPNEINRHLEIFISPQFHYWPQTGNPVKITFLFNKKCIPGKVLCLFDENKPLIEIMTDEKGSVTYLPAEDKKLNWEGETAFKESVIVVEEYRKNTKYISSYTLPLHRCRFNNRKLLTGVGIFLGTMIAVFLFVSIKRKRFNLEYY